MSEPEFFPLIASDICAINGKLSCGERAVSHVLANLLWDIDAARGLLELLCDEAAPDYDSGHGLIAGEVRRLLSEAATTAVVVHALMAMSRSDVAVH